MSANNPEENLLPIGEILERLIKPLPQGVVFHPGAWHWLGVASGVTKEDVFPTEATAQLQSQPATRPSC